MAAIQQIGQGSSGLALSYVPPDGEPPNPAAAFLSSWLGQRTPWTQAVFMKRLQAIDPRAQQASIQALVDERTKLIQQYEASRRAAATNRTTKGASDNDLLRAMIAAQASDRSAAAQENAAATNQATELIKQDQVHTDEGRAALKSAKDAVAAAVDASAQKRDPRTIMDNLSNGLADAREAIDNAKLDAGERRAITDELNSMSLPGDSATQQRLGAAIAHAFPPGQAPIKPQVSRGGTRTVDDLANDFLQLRGDLGEAGVGPGAVGGGGSSGGSRSSSTSTSERGNPVVTPGGGSRTGEAYAPSSGVDMGEPSGELGKALQMIDSMIAQRQQDYATNPYGQLGGFNDRLPGLQRGSRKAQAATAAQAKQSTATRNKQQLDELLPTDPLMRKPLDNELNDIERDTPEGKRDPFANLSKPAAKSSGKGTSRSPGGRVKSSDDQASDDAANADMTRSNQMAALAAMLPKTPLVPGEPDDRKGDAYARARELLPAMEYQQLQTPGTTPPPAPRRGIQIDASDFQQQLDDLTSPIRSYQEWVDAGGGELPRTDLLSGRDPNDLTDEEKEQLRMLLSRGGKIPAR
ncbi:MAG TPA: hypothetical protein VI792_03240 [Candidatus Eisenbacteria bacterium]